jgi:uncharacterized protein (TIGR03663 family)
MHTDEAVHAIKFATLLEENTYQYDPTEYHGPTLNYLTLIPAWISSANQCTEVNEATLRIVPVLFGVFLILGLLRLGDGLDRSILLFAGLFTAISPAMVYYSRYYIQEILLVAFTFGVIISGYHYLKSRHVTWAFSTGFFLGLMLATKETGVIAIAAMLLALPLTFFLFRDQRENGIIPKLSLWHLLIIIFTCLFVSVLFYSSFFTHPKGVLDSILAYKNYFYKAGHFTWHQHPWFYYFRLLIGTNPSSGLFWSEAVILIFAMIGMITIFQRLPRALGHRPFLRFIAFYTLIMTVIYSFIPYKTPWSMLGFYHGFILLAAVGAASLLMIAIRRRKQLIFMILFFISACHLLIQAYLLNHHYDTEPTNPYVYAHTSRDVLTINKVIQHIAKHHPDGLEMAIDVICPGDDYWPFPWYFRSLPNVGWFNQVSLQHPSAPVIIAKPEVESDLLQKLYEIPAPGEKNLYIPLFRSYMELRPQIEIRGYIRKDLWDLIETSSLNHEL